MGALAELRMRVEEFASKFLPKDDFDRWKRDDYEQFKRRSLGSRTTAEQEVAQIAEDLRTKGEALLEAAVNRLAIEELKPRIAEYLKDAISGSDIADWLDNTVDLDTLIPEIAAQFVKTLKLEDIKGDLVPAIADLFYEDLDNESLESSIADSVTERIKVTLEPQ